MDNLAFGGGIWHFAIYMDSYATDGYGEARDVIEAIALPGRGRTSRWSI